MIVALGLDVGVGHEEHGEDDGNNIPSRQNQTLVDASDTQRGDYRSVKNETIPESLCDGTHLLRSVPCRESHHSGDLKQTDLESIRRTDFHAEGILVSAIEQPRTHQDVPPEGNVSMQSERNSIHELRGVRYESEQGNSKELFIDPRPFEHNVDHTDKQFCTKQSIKHLPKRMKVDAPAMMA